MAWIRGDTAILFDEFCDNLSSDEFRAWSYLLLYIKSTGARGSAPAPSYPQMAKIAKVPLEAIQTMFEKAGDRFKIEKGRIYVKNWHRYQEDHRDKSASPEKSGDTINGLTPQYSTPQYPTKELLATRKSAQNEKELIEKSFLLRPDEAEFAIWNARIKAKIAQSNGNAPFTWRPTTGSFESDLKKLVYSFPDERKRSLLWETYNSLGILNWLKYVERGIDVMLEAARRKPIHDPYKFMVSILQVPAQLIPEPGKVFNKFS